MYICKCIYIFENCTQQLEVTHHFHAHMEYLFLKIMYKTIRKISVNFKGGKDKKSQHHVDMSRSTETGNAVYILGNETETK